MKLFVQLGKLRSSTGKGNMNEFQWGNLSFMTGMNGNNPFIRDIHIFSLSFDSPVRSDHWVCVTLMLVMGMLRHAVEIMSLIEAFRFSGSNLSLGKQFPHFSLIGCVPFADVAFDVSTGEESFSRRICLFFGVMVFSHHLPDVCFASPNKNKSRRTCKGKNNNNGMVGSLLKNSLGYDSVDWYHYITFLETFDSPRDSSRCPSNCHTTCVVPSFVPQWSLKKQMMP